MKYSVGFSFPLLRPKSHHFRFNAEILSSSALRSPLFFSLKLKSCSEIGRLNPLLYSLNSLKSVKYSVISASRFRSSGSEEDERVIRSASLQPRSNIGRKD